ncbi:Uncharacterised protein [Enterobacter cloacae]|nr:Uncharacterised protein [Enterobacter cloacae]
MEKLSFYLFVLNLVQLQCLPADLTNIVRKDEL